MRTRLLLTSTLLLAAVAHAAPGTLPPIPMRGLGTIQATSEATAPGTSLLRMRCESVARAQLTQAKYLSDLGSIPGTRAIQLAGGIQAHATATGAVAALRDGAQVLVATAPTPEMLSVMLKSIKHGAWKSKAEVPVPMWLDRWDKFGWRFYYREFEQPPGWDEAKNGRYDPRPEFAWAKQQGVGLVFWDALNQLDAAHGMRNEVFWDWAAREAEQQNLPVGLNLSGGTFGTPSWIANRFREQMTRKAPQFVGNFHRIASPDLGAMGMASWSATTAEAAMMSALQGSVRRFSAQPNITTFLEPHGELRHGSQDLFLEYGPQADLGYRKYLQAKYRTTSALNAAWFKGEAAAKPLHLWSDVRAPEAAEFANWNADALDLRGDWRIGYAADASAVPEEWLSEGFDASSWPTIVAPGHDRAMFLPQKRAVLRRSFDVASIWRAARPRTWLYLWDLNTSVPGTGVSPIRAALNGKLVGEGHSQHPEAHWGAWEVTDTLRAGSNTLALDLPQGGIYYRAYLSHHEPRQYPNLGEGMNARWVDFMGWMQASRLDKVRGGMEMIREVDPNRSIVLMAPDIFADGVKDLAARYGGEMHDTGYMGAFYADLLPALSRGAGLPFSLEPGGPADNLQGFKKLLGLYQTEAIQGVDYFIHIGNVLWNPEIRAHFEATRPLTNLIGKYHASTAQLALLYPHRINALTGFPWINDASTNLGAGYWRWNVGAALARFEHDGLSESDLQNGSAQKYGVVIDTNTSILDEAQLGGIERYVRGGGTFITFAQTGRHTPTRRDSWPISALSGYQVLAIEKHNADGSVPDSERRRLQLPPASAARKPIFSQADIASMNAVRANGLSLRAARNASGTVDLLRWEDGSTAIGARKLGAGWVVQVGAKFHEGGMFDRIEPGGDSREMQALSRLMRRLLQWRGVAPVPARLQYAGQQFEADGASAPWEDRGQRPIRMRHYLSNNGLFDLWALWNESATKPARADLGFDAIPLSIADAQSGKPVAIAAGSVAVSLEPMQTQVLVAPRRDIGAAPLDWLRLQQNWWRASKAPAKSAPVAAPVFSDTLDLSDGWQQEAATQADASKSNSSGPLDSRQQSLGLRSVRVAPGSAREIEMLTRSFVVPPSWTGGRVELWLHAWWQSTFLDRARVQLDGKTLRDWGDDGIKGDDIGGALKPGTRHVLSIETQSAGPLIGSRGAAWLAFRPDASSSLDLAGQWQTSRDFLSYAAPIALPGAYDARSLRRQVQVPDSAQGKRIVLHVDASGGLLGAIVNGSWVRRFHHLIGERWDLDVTPWIRAGQQNEIELVTRDNPDKGTVRALRLDFYEPEATR